MSQYQSTDTELSILNSLMMEYVASFVKYVTNKTIIPERPRAMIFTFWSPSFVNSVVRVLRVPVVHMRLGEHTRNIECRLSGICLSLGDLD